MSSRSKKVWMPQRSQRHAKARSPEVKRNTKPLKRAQKIPLLPFFQKKRKVKKYQPKKTHPQANIKIFKPKEEVSEVPEIGKKTQGSTSWFTQQLQSVSSIYTEAKLWASSTTVGAIFSHFNHAMIAFTGFAFLSFFLYLSLFDTFFLINTYTVTFDEGSLLSKGDTEELLENIRKDKFLGFIPNNQFWFLNSQNLTLSARKVNTEVRKVEVVQREWPNKAELLISTEPILLTLSLPGDGGVWRISQYGDVLSKDTASVLQNVVYVDRQVEFNRKGTTLQDYSFQNNPEQLNRFWFIAWLWDQLEDKGVTVSRTSIPSLFDGDVTITTNSGVKLYFNYAAMSRDILHTRIDTLFGPTNVNIQDNLDKGLYSYIDLRVPRRIFICNVGTECAV